MSTQPTRLAAPPDPPEIRAFRALVAAVRHGWHGDVIRLTRELRRYLF